MPIVKVLAALAVADIEAARAWYEQLLGRPADDVPMAEAAEWHVTGTGSIQLVQDAERAGYSLVTLSVDDVDELVAALAGRDLELAAADTPSGMFRIASITDPEGNVITFAEDLRRT
jgi:predicted enzyme related to lactoylglutathione lyase